MGAVCTTKKVVQIEQGSLPKENALQTQQQNILALRAVDLQSPSFSVILSPFRLSRADAEVILAETKPGCYTLSHDLTSELFISQSAGKYVIHHSISRRGSVLYVGGENFKTVREIIEHFKKHPLGEIKLTEELTTKPKSIANGDKHSSIGQDSSSGIRSASYSDPNDNINHIEALQSKDKRNHKVSETTRLQEITQEKEGKELIMTANESKQPRIKLSPSRSSVSSAGEKDLPFDEPLPILPEPSGARPPPLFPRFSTLTRNLSPVSLDDGSETFDLKHASYQLFKGKTAIAYPSSRRTLKVFLIGQQDTFRERQLLVTSTLPCINKLCAEYGHACDILDTSILHEVQYENLTMPWIIDNGDQIMKKEIDQCVQNQLPVLAMVFLGQKYGPLSFPASLPKDIFENIRSQLKSEMATEAMTRLYELDTNCLDPCYVLKDGFTNNTIDDERVLFEQFLNAAFSFSQNQKDIWKYYAPAFEKDLKLLTSSLPELQLVVVERMIEGLETRASLSCEKFPIEYFDSPDANAYYQLQARQNELKEELYSTTSSSHYLKYKIEITALEEDTENLVPSDINKLVEDLVYDKTLSLLSENVSRGITTWLQSEILYHVQRSAKLAEYYKAPSSLMQTVKAYLEGPYRKPLVLFGGSKHFRAATVANTNKMAFNWLGDSCCVVTRYIGHSQDSTSLVLLLQSICLQLSHAYSTDPSAVPQDLKDMVAFFPLLLQLATDSQPLVVCLNDVHLVDSKNSQYDVFSFIPPKLGNFVKIILTGNKEVHASAKRYFRDNNSFREVPTDSKNSASELLDYTLLSSNRTLSEQQKDRVQNVFNSCSSPGFVYVLHNVLLSWRSDKSIDNVPENISDCLKQYLDAVEKTFDKQTLHDILKYLTVANVGIPLSLLITNIINNKLQDPKNRVEEQLQWKHHIRQVLSALGHMVLTDTLHGEPIIKWADDAYPAYVRMRYFHSTDEETAYLSRLVGHLCQMKNAFPNSGSLSYNAVSYPADTHSDRVYNLIKFCLLPIYIFRTKNIDDINSTIFFDFNFLQMKLNAMTVNHLVNDLCTTLSIVSAQKYLLVLKEALELASEALTFDPKQFASQLLSRLLRGTYPMIYGEKTSLSDDIAPNLPLGGGDQDANRTDDMKMTNGNCCGQFENHDSEDNSLPSVIPVDAAYQEKTFQEELDKLVEACQNSDSVLIPSAQCLLKPPTLCKLDAEEQRKELQYITDVRFLFSNHGTEYLIAWSSTCDSISIFKDNGVFLKHIRGLRVKRIPFAIGLNALLETSEGTVLYDLMSETILANLEPELCYFAVCDENTMAAIKNDWKCLALYDIKTRTCVWEYVAPKGRNFRNVLVSKHGTVGVCLTEESNGYGPYLLDDEETTTSTSYHVSRDEMIVLSLQRREEMHRLFLKDGQFFYKVCSVSEDGRYLVHLTEPEKHLLVWDLLQGNLLHELEIRPLRLLKVHVSSIGDCILAVSADSFVRVWNLIDGKSRFVLSEPVRSIRGGYMDDTHCLCMSEDGSKAIHSVKSNFLYSYVVLWDLIKGNILATFTTDFYGLTFDLSPTGNFIVTNMPSGIVTLQINDHQKVTSEPHTLPLEEKDCF